MGFVLSRVIQEFAMKFAGNRYENRHFQRKPAHTNAGERIISHTDR